MTQKIPCDREGNFRGRIVEYGLKEFDSGAVSVKFRAELDEIWDGQNEIWCPWSEYEMEVYGDAFVIKKDGTLNEPAVNSLVKHASWDGSFASINNLTWQPTPCQFSVKKQEYQGNVYYNAAFINGFDDKPGGALPTLDEAKVKSLDQRFAGQLRALTGNKMRNQSPPPANSKPTSPPKPASKAAPKVSPADEMTPTLAAAHAHAASGDIPF